jgi:hypothetical protein
MVGDSSGLSYARYIIIGQLKKNPKFPARVDVSCLPPKTVPTRNSFAIRLDPWRTERKASTDENVKDISLLVPWHISC